MHAVQFIYILSLLLNIGIICLVVYAIYAIIKRVRKHFALLHEIQQSVEGIRQKIDQLNR